MTFLLKDPDAVLDYSVDWGAEYLGDDQLATSEEIGATGQSARCETCLKRPRKAKTNR